MKHFIGGFAVGMIAAIRWIPKSTGQRNGDYIAASIAHGFIALLFGLAAWGLL